MQNTLYTITGTVTLKKGAGRSLKTGGMWVYDNEISSISSSSDGDIQDGGLVHVLDFDGFFLGTGFLNRRSKITVRLLARRKETVIDDAFWEKRVRDAWEYRKRTVDTGSCRVIFGEADWFPGLVVDKFSDVLVAESLALGIDRFKPLILDILRRVLAEDGISVRGIYERSDAKVRLQEGMERFKGFLSEPFDTRVQIEEYGVKYLSLYAFSEENWGRPQAEVDALMLLMFKSMVEELSNFMENGIRFVVLGHREKLSDELNAVIDDCMRKTSGNDRLTLIVFLSYSGKWDILQAAKRYARDLIEHPDEAESMLEMGIEGFDRYLVTAGIPDPDLIIRTSGEMRLSNYLLWQGAYSELLFTDVLWPDFRKDEFLSALRTYSKRDRRYGKVK